MYRVFSVTISIVAVVCITSESSLVYAAASSGWQESLAHGDNYANKRELSKAEQCFRQALLKVGQGSHSAEDKSKCLNSLANTLALENKTIEAESTLFKSLSLLEQAYGKNSSKLIPTLLAIGSVYESMGNHVLAMRFYSKASTIGEYGYGQYCPPFSSNSVHMDSEKKILQFGIKTDSSLSGSGLKQGASLESSEHMKNVLPSFSEDALKYECTSNEDLLTDFKHDITQEGSR
jgi:tetratricopeptide (TPR) repeat protein